MPSWPFCGRTDVIQCCDVNAYFRVSCGLDRSNKFGQMQEIMSYNYSDVKCSSLSGKGAAVFAEGLSGAVASGLGKVRYLN